MRARGGALHALECVASHLLTLKCRYKIRSMTTQRITPLEAPYAHDVEAALAKWMPPGSPVPALALFHVIARHPMLWDRMRPRTTARCGAEYEWGIHATAVAAAAGLSAEVVRSTVTESPVAAASRAGDDAVILRAADELHDRGALKDSTFSELQGLLGESEMLELPAVCGFYHASTFVIGVARIECEPWAMAMPAEASTEADRPLREVCP